MMIFVYINRLFTESSQSQGELRMRNSSPSRDDVDASTINPNDPTESGHLGKIYGHITADYTEAKHIRRLPFRQPSEIIKIKPFQDNQTLDFKKLYREKEALNLYDFYYPDGHPNPQAQYAFDYQPQRVEEEMHESSYRLFQSHYPHGLPHSEPQLAFHDHEAHPINKDMDDNTYTLFHNHYPFGLLDPQTQTQPHASSGNRYPALHEKDDPRTSGGYSE